MLKINAHLSLAVCLFFLAEDQILHISLCDCRELKSHIRLIYGTDIVQLMPEPFCYEAAVSCEIFYRFLVLPAAFFDKPFGACKVVKGYDWLNSERIAEIEHIFVMSDLFLVKFTLARLDPCPLNGEAIGIKSCLGKKLYILFVSIVMVNCIEAGLKEACGAHLLHCPIIAVYVIAFYLMGGS